jgi:hypothetical protein
MRRISYAILVSVLIVIQAGCQEGFTRESPLPRKTVAMIADLESITASLTEWAPQMVMAATIIENRAQEDGTAGEVCDAIALVEPNLVQLDIAQPATVKALRTMVEQIEKIKNSLDCEDLISE